ncbi:MAG: hypothetical protein QOJ16_4735, partial [Acidobacteriota bacterium]|nr:hypothetical protein [Acidobacteriota bacterium]
MKIGQRPREETMSGEQETKGPDLRAGIG